MKSLQLNSNRRNNLFISDKGQNNKNSNETQALIPINPDDPVLQKIHDTTLLLLINPNYRKTMDPDLNPIGALINKGVWINDPILGEMAIIEIYLKPGENPVRVEQYAYQVRGYYPNENVVVATVPINKIYSIISLPEVNSINLVIPGITD